MSFRTRVLIAFAAVALLPLILLGVGVRRQLTTRLTSQHTQRVQALARVAEEDLDSESASIAARLATLAGSLPDDNRFRLGAVHGIPDDRAYVLDYAEQAMRLAGLAMLQIQSDEGRILSSGHFRNEFDRLEPELPRLLAAAQNAPVLVRARAADGPFLAFVRSDSARVGGRWFTLVGGVTVDRRLLARFARDGEIGVSLVTPADTIVSDSAHRAADGGVASSLPLAYADTRVADSARLVPARLIVTHSLAEVDALHREVNQWTAVALITAAAGALVLGLWLSARVTAPLAELARATTQIDLDGPEIELATARDDEIGTLARRLGGMARRLRLNAYRLRDAERRATVGEMARQVNHDIKNGLIPIRNVLRHLTQVQEQRPDELPSVFAERRPTLESSVGYLDTLARNYARLTPRVEHAQVDTNAVVREAVGSASAGGASTIHTRLADGIPPVLGDPVVLRRIVDNLLRNAIESLNGSDGLVRLDTGLTPEGSVRIVVADTGRGMTEHELAHAFDDFFTTKDGGTGLGLSVVRRLTTDLHGSLKVESSPGRGTSVTIDLPAFTAPVRRTPRDR